MYEYPSETDSACDTARERRPAICPCTRPAFPHLKSTGRWGRHRPAQAYPFSSITATHTCASGKRAASLVKNRIPCRPIVVIVVHVSCANTAPATRNKFHATQRNEPEPPFRVRRFLFNRGLNRAYRFDRPYLQKTANETRYLSPVFFDHWITFEENTDVARTRLPFSSILQFFS